MNDLKPKMTLKLPRLPAEIPYDDHCTYHPLTKQYVKHGDLLHSKSYSDRSPPPFQTPDNSHKFNQPPRHPSKPPLTSPRSRNDNFQNIHNDSNIPSLNFTSITQQSIIHNNSQPGITQMKPIHNEVVNCQSSNEKNASSSDNHTKLPVDLFIKTKFRGVTPDRLITDRQIYYKSIYKLYLFILNKSPVRLTFESVARREDMVPQKNGQSYSQSVLFSVFSSFFDEIETIGLLDVIFDLFLSFTAKPYTETYIETKINKIEDVQTATSSASHRNIPKLSLAGLAPCLQGTGLIGAVPPEEPKPEGEVINQIDSVHSHREFNWSEDEYKYYTLLYTIYVYVLFNDFDGTEYKYLDTYPFISGKNHYLFVATRLHEMLFSKTVIDSHFSIFFDLVANSRKLQIYSQLLSDRDGYSSSIIHTLGAGAFGVVSKVEMNLVASREDGEHIPPKHFAIKQLPREQSLNDKSTLFYVFNEIDCVQRCEQQTDLEFDMNNQIIHQSICKILDYGTDSSGLNFFMTMPFYDYSLSRFLNTVSNCSNISQNSFEFGLNKLLFTQVKLSIFSKILLGVFNLHKSGVVHYDLKCDNILINYSNSDNILPPYEFRKRIHNFLQKNRAQYHQNHNDLVKTRLSQVLRANLSINIPSVAIADFGEAKPQFIDAPICKRNRGTEAMKSPEMLVMEFSTQKNRSSYDRRKTVGTGTGCDIWSLGCLFYELMTNGDYLFNEDKWIEFFLRVTGGGIRPELNYHEENGGNPQQDYDDYIERLGDYERAKEVFGGDILTEGNKELLNDISPHLVNFILFVLVRDPIHRPTIEQIISRFKEVYVLVLNDCVCQLR